MSRAVTEYGPSNAKVLFIGEHPNKQAERAGRPFTGVDGEEARRALRMAGVHDVGEVQWAYAVGKNPQGKFPSGRAGSQLLKEWAPRLDRVVEASEASVMVLCGGQALKRFTGLTNITDWSGSVLEADWVRTWVGPSGMIDMGNGIKHPLVLPKGVKYIVPCIHPGGYMVTKSKDDLPLFYRVIDKVGRILNGTLEDYPFRPVISPPLKKLHEALADAKRRGSGKADCAFDTEFNPETGQLFQVGLTFDGETIYGFNWQPKYYGFVRDLMRDHDVTKIAHNIRADWDIVEQNKMPIEGPKYCTMIGTYVLHPEFRVGLSPSSRYYLDKVMHTKWMDKDDAIYNCYDVQFCWYLKVKQTEELRSRLMQTGTDQQGVMDSRQALIELAWRMEQEGLQLDQDVRKALINSQDDIVAGYLGEVMTSISPFWEVRYNKVKDQLEEANATYRDQRRAYAKHCKKHPSYYPGRKPPKGCEICLALHTSKEGEQWRIKYAKLRKDRDKLKIEMKKLDKGFNFKSGADLAWLLYSAEALNMPIRRNKSGNPATNADAIERMSRSPAARRKEGFHVVLKIKEMQQAVKAKSTFLDIPHDENDRVHPPYKVHGTRTGRIAGGQDVSGEKDKVSKKYAYNILNIPKDWREIYVAPPGKCIVAADWKNQEGRLMALFSQDKAYKQAFREEDSGGFDVHSVTASILYGIDPGDSRKEKTKFNGSMYDMRHCAKVANHAVSYSPTPEKTLMYNFQMELNESIRIVDALNEARPGIAAYKRKLIEDVLGRWEPFESRGNWYAACKQPGALWDANPFGWLLYFYGGATVSKDARTGERIALPDQAGEVVAMRQQSSGGEMWTRSGLDLFEYDIPMTGTYDSFYMLCDDTDEGRQDMAGILTNVMTQPWPELDNTSFPIDLEYGYNLKNLKELK